MSDRRTVILAMVSSSLFLATAFAPTAAALEVCQPAPTRYNVLTEGPSEHHFACDTSFDAFLVVVENDLPLFSAGPSDKAPFVVCLLDADGHDLSCHEGCGHLLFQGLEGVTAIRVTVGLAQRLGCLAVEGTVTAIFADE